MKSVVVIPTYNEVENIANILARLSNNNPDQDIIVVDDNSPDGTADEVKKLMVNLSNVHCIVRQKKDGRGGAVIEGFKYAVRNSKKYDLFVEMDADMSHNPDELKSLIEKTKNYDIVIGSRHIEGSRIINWPLRRRVFSRLANLYAKLFLRVPINDYTNGYRVYNLKALESLLDLNIKLKGYIALSESIYKLFNLGCTVTEVPTVFVNRKKGASNTNPKELMDAFWGVIKIKFKFV